jgi:CRP-like cAMP-binding protein
MVMDQVHEALIRKLKEHSKLNRDDISEICSFSYSIRNLAPDEDVIRQGDEPKFALLVVLGNVGRYHLLPEGRRQFLSFHMKGDLPDAQGLFLQKMDHAVCAIGNAVIASISHKQIVRAFDERPQVGFAIWRETLIDAAIFREAITNNSARPPTARMAHFFCELFFRANAAGLVRDNTIHFPLSLGHLAETLGMAIATVNRSLQELRNSNALDFRNGDLVITDWIRSTEIGQFSPSYLHLKTNLAF